MDSRDPVVVFFEKSVIQSITLLRKWDFFTENPFAATSPVRDPVIGRRDDFAFSKFYKVHGAIPPVL